MSLPLGDFLKKR